MTCATRCRLLGSGQATMPRVAEALRPTLGETGQVYVTLAAARQFMEGAGYEEHELETARRRVTELLLDARPRQADPRMWRARKRSTKLDLSALVEQEGRLFVVTFISVQPYDPPSRTSGDRSGRRSRLPGESRSSSVATRGTSAPSASRALGRRGTRST
jgi:hypothetical protein